MLKALKLNSQSESRSSTMELDRSLSVIFSVVSIASLFSCAFSSSFISDGVFDAHSSTGRSLLQARKGCPVNFEFLNYTIITSKCKGPHYPAESCCSAFKEFACPYAETINEVSNDCASTMFSYINLYGRYPPGLFASECREGKDGLECPALPPSQPIRNAATSHVKPLLLYMLLSAFLAVFLLHLF